MTRISIRVPEGLADIAPAYLSNRIRDLDVLKDALDRGDFTAIAALMHRTKGTAASYGFRELGELAKTLENASKNGNREDAIRALARMREHLSLVEIVG